MNAKTAVISLFYQHITPQNGCPILAQIARLETAWAVTFCDAPNEELPDCYRLGHSGCVGNHVAVIQYLAKKFSIITINIQTGAIQRIASLVPGDKEISSIFPLPCGLRVMINYGDELTLWKREPLKSTGLYPFNQCQKIQKTSFSLNIFISHLNEECITLSAKAKFRVLIRVADGPLQFYLGNIIDFDIVPPGRRITRTER